MGRGDAAIRKCWQECVGNGRFQRHNGNGRPGVIADQEARLIVRSTVTAPDSSLSIIRRATHTRTPLILIREDKAKPHVARVAKNCLTACQTLPSPAILPYFSSIQHVWNMKGRRLHLPGIADDLARQLGEMMQEIPQESTRCNNRTVMAQRKYLDDFLRGRIIGRLEYGHTQLEVSEELGIAQNVISRLWQRFQDDATGTTVSRQTVYRRLGNIGLYALTPVRCVPLTTTHCRLRLTWNREHVLWAPQQWSCVMFSDESRFSLQSDSHLTLIWRAPGTCYHQDNTIERHRYGGAGWLVWGGVIFGFRN
ncbi:HTH_Tnp_Tc3_2 domain-containing protein [Trichonephila clavipes]|nr:HTH_Tnp_Tc3_2 domain-containing protein [Trichonephila clavipes]